MRFAVLGGGCAAGGAFGARAVERANVTGRALRGRREPTPAERGGPRTVCSVGAENRLLQRIDIDHILRHIRELVIGVPFLVKRTLKQVGVLL